MNHDLWSVYLSLQTELAYGTSIGHSPASEGQASSAAKYIEQLVAHRPMERSLVIGPGGPSELTSLRRLPKPIHALTAHIPERDLIAAARLPDVYADAGDIHDMPFEDNIFDFVYASNVLEHTFAPYVALLECRRVLRAGGIGYFVLPSFEGKEGGTGPFHLHCLSKDVWMELLRKTGLVSVDIHVERGGEDPAGYYVHYKTMATEPPEPHSEMLRRVKAYKNSKRAPS